MVIRLALPEILAIWLDLAVYCKHLTILSLYFFNLNFKISIFLPPVQSLAKNLHQPT